MFITSLSDSSVIHYLLSSMLALLSTVALLFLFRCLLLALVSVPWFWSYFNKLYCAVTQLHFSCLLGSYSTKPEKVFFPRNQILHITMYCELIVLLHFIYNWSGIKVGRLQFVLVLSLICNKLEFLSDQLYLEKKELYDKNLKNADAFSHFKWQENWEHLHD